jgi:hypothetical protein
MPDSPTPWYNDATVVRSYVTALTNAEIDSEDLIAILKHPKQYSDTYDSWASFGFPESEDDDGWDDFVAEISNEDETEDEDED